MRGQTKTVSDVLFEMAEGQQGYFTAKQSAYAGYQLGTECTTSNQGIGRASNGASTDWRASLN